MSTEIMVPAQEPTLMSLIDRLLTTNPNTNIETIQKMLEMQERWEDRQAMKAFNLAFAEFKAEAVTIVKNSVVTSGPLKDTRYANLFDVVDAIVPAMSRHQLSHSWHLSKDEPLWMEVTCTISHALGYSKQFSMGAAPDAGPGRNAIQARGSAKSYLERYTLLGAAGMAASGQDDDGNGGMSADEKTVRGEVEKQKSEGKAGNVPPELDWSWNKTTGVLIARIVGAKELKTKGGKPYLTLAFNNAVEGRPLASYWHNSHLEDLKASVGKVVKLVVKVEEKFNQIEGVLEIDGKRTEKTEDSETTARLLASTLNLDEKDLKELYTRFAHNSWAEVVRMLEERKAAIDNPVDVTE